MKPLFTALMLPLAALAVVDVAFMVAEWIPVWTEAVEYVRNDQRFDEVYLINCQNLTPSLELMQRFDVIFVGGGEYKDQEDFGDNLADYVDGGGFVVSIFFAFFYYPEEGFGIGGRWLEDCYTPYKTVIGDWFYYFVRDYRDLNILEPEHPIFQGVSHLKDVRDHFLLELQPGAREIADFTYYPGIAINADNTVVGLDYDCSDYSEWTGDGFLIMANAACWLAAQTDVRETSWGVLKAEFE